MTKLAVFDRRPGCSLSGGYKLVGFVERDVVEYSVLEESIPLGKPLRKRTRKAVDLFGDDRLWAITSFQLIDRQNGNAIISHDTVIVQASLYRENMAELTDLFQDENLE